MVRMRSAVRFREWAPKFIGMSFSGRTAVSKTANECSIHSIPAKQLCKHHVTNSEHTVLNDLVQCKMLSFTDGKYSPTDKLIKTLKDYIK